MLAALGPLLVLFHAWLFAGLLWDGTLAEPGALARWFVAGGIATALVCLQRSGAPVLFGRKAVALWLLAALLHGPAVADRARSIDTPAPPEAATIVQIAAESFALSVGLLLVAGTLRRASYGPQLFVTTAFTDERIVSASSGFVLAFAARPPPIA